MGDLDFIWLFVYFGELQTQLNFKRFSSFFYSLWWLCEIILFVTASHSVYSDLFHFSSEKRKKKEKKKSFKEKWKFLAENCTLVRLIRNHRSQFKIRIKWNEGICWAKKNYFTFRTKLVSLNRINESFLRRKLLIFYATSCIFCVIHFGSVPMLLRKCFIFIFIRFGYNIYNSNLISSLNEIAIYLKFIRMPRESCSLIKLTRFT